MSFPRGKIIAIAITVCYFILFKFFDFYDPIRIADEILPLGVLSGGRGTFFLNVQVTAVVGLLLILVSPSRVDVFNRLSFNKELVGFSLRFLGWFLLLFAVPVIFIFTKI